MISISTYFRSVFIKILNNQVSNVSIYIIAYLVVPRADLNFYQLYTDIMKFQMQDKI